MDDDLRAFCDFNSMHMEPGTARRHRHDRRSLRHCALDRNGLRPARYVITMTSSSLASEVGTWDYPRTKCWKGRVGPGKLFVVDTSNGAIWTSLRN